MKPFELINCACGCGTAIKRYDANGREHRFVSGHNTVLRGGPCGVEGCERRRRRYGLCDMHAQRMKHNGTLEAAKREWHGLSDTPEYEVWCSMKGRCENPRDSGYALYGGRGIKICASWRDSFIVFLAYVGTRPTPTHSLDRIDVDGNYEPGNVRWATPSVQGQNKRTRSATGFRGVFLDPRNGRFNAAIHRRPAPSRTIGVFKTAEEAARAYDRAALEIFGPTACLNFPLVPA